MTAKPLLATLLVVLTGVGAARAQAPLDTPIQKFSYAIGLQMAGQIVRQMRQQGIETLDPDALAQAFQDVFSGTEPRLSVEEMQQAASSFAEERRSVQAAAAGVNLERGTAFLEKNKSADGVAVLESGVQYKILTVGNGPMPTAEDKVLVHYRGRLLDGTEFDSSYGRGEPTAFGVSQVIVGWQQALMAMPTGSKWEVWIPAALAYGERGAGGRIGPNETLHFEIELIEIEG